MKKIIIILTVVAGLSLVGCGSNQDNVEDYLLDYNVNMSTEQYESFCEAYQGREATEDICYEYNVNQAMLDGIYTVKEMQELKAKND